MTKEISNQMIKAARSLCKSVDQIQFPAPVAWTYNPLDYGRAAHEDYLKRYASNRKRYIFLGMNPGPFGMVQTGVPFGEISFVRDWLGISEIKEQPEHTHPKRPIQGFDCTRSEVSGKRLWGLFQEKFGTARAFLPRTFCRQLLSSGLFGRNGTQPDTRQTSLAITQGTLRALRRSP